MIELIEAYPCNSRDELNKVEGKYIREKSCVNKVIAGQTKEEYQECNTSKIKNRKKLYYEENKDILKMNKKTYYEQTKDYQSALKNQVMYCSCGKSYTHSNRVRHQKSTFHMKNKKE
jgi:hypothetical protein